MLLNIKQLCLVFNELPQLFVNLLANVEANVSQPTLQGKRSLELAQQLILNYFIYVFLKTLCSKYLDVLQQCILTLVLLLEYTDTLWTFQDTEDGEGTSNLSADKSSHSSYPSSGSIVREVAAPAQTFGSDVDKELARLRTVSLHITDVINTETVNDVSLGSMFSSSTLKIDRISTFSIGGV